MGYYLFPSFVLRLRFLITTGRAHMVVHDMASAACTTSLLRMQQRPQPGFFMRDRSGGLHVATGFPMSRHGSWAAVGSWVMTKVCNCDRIPRLAGRVWVATEIPLSRQSQVSPMSRHGMLCRDKAGARD